MTTISDVAFSEVTAEMVAVGDTVRVTSLNRLVVDRVVEVDGVKRLAFFGHSLAELKDLGWSFFVKA